MFKFLAVVGVMAMALFGVTVVVLAQESRTDRLFPSESVVTRNGNRYELSKPTTIGSGSREAIKFLVTYRNNGDLLFRDYIQIWGYGSTGDDSRDRAGIQSILMDTVDLTVAREGFFVPEFPGTISVFLATANDGRLLSTDNTWTTAQACAGTCSVEVNNAIALSNTVNGPSPFSIVNSFYSFDTSTLPDAVLIEAAVFQLFSDGLHIGNDSSMTLVLREYNWGDTLTTTDWIDFSVATNWTSLPLAGWIPKPTQAEAQTTITFNSTIFLIFAINSTGTTRLATALDKSTSVNPPLDAQSVKSYYGQGSVDPTLRPRLTVTHCFMSPCVPPTPTPTPTPIPPTEIVLSSTDMTIFLWVIGFLAGLVFIGYGERSRQGTYIFVGAFLLIASSLGMGIVLITVLSAAAFIPLAYRGYLLIAEQTNTGGRFE